MKCPICGSRIRFTNQVGSMYDCGTWRETKGHTSQGDACVLIHYESMKETVKQLEATIKRLETSFGILESLK